MRKVILGTLTWLVAITAAHLSINVNWQVLLNDRMPREKRKLNVAYIPVT